MSDLIQSEDDNSESEAFSDISDNSDMFHVATRDSAPPRTPEDVDLALIDSIAAHLRDYPLLPPDVSDPQGEQSFKDVASGIRFPIVHCGFKGYGSGTLSLNCRGICRMCTKTLKLHVCHWEPGGNLVRSITEWMPTLTTTQPS